jgi:signal transduction histidine kinase
MTEYEEMLHSMIGQSVDGIALFDRAGFVLEWNPALGRLLDIPPERALRANLAELAGLIHLDPPVIDQAFGKMRTLGEDFADSIPPEWLERSPETQVLHSDGTVRMIRGRVFIVRRAKGSMVGVIVEDITERKKTERLLQDSELKLRNLALHLLSTREEERKNVTREIHDELGQALTSLKMDMRWLQKRMPPGRNWARVKLEEMAALVDRTIGAVQRISFNLRPQILDDLGLAAGIQWLCGQFTMRTTLPCETRMEVAEARIGGDVSTALFRVVQESLTNISRHAKATRVVVRLGEAGGHLEAEIVDNGVGISEQRIADPRSIGLIGMRARIEHLQGEFSISGCEGQGTTVRVSLPALVQEGDG